MSPLQASLSFNNTMNWEVLEVVAAGDEALPPLVPRHLRGLLVVLLCLHLRFQNEEGATSAPLLLPCWFADGDVEFKFRFFKQSPLATRFRALLGALKASPMERGQARGVGHRIELRRMERAFGARGWERKNI
jgi:hypothetical protein